MSSFYGSKRVLRRPHGMTPDEPTRKAADHGTETRLDRWLWAARFFKTRGVAADAISGGRVHLNDARTKPAKPARIGDRIAVQRGELVTTVVVRGLAEQRRPAPEAALLYEETPESVLAREAHQARRRDAAAGRFERLGRPTKQDRRESIRLRRGS
jgi:ribosome-associated heat shock protein Hsp15